MNVSRLNRVSFLLAATVTLSLLPPVRPALAEEFTVTTTADTTTCDPGNCSLRGAIIKANASPGADVIMLPEGTYLLTIPGADGSEANVNDARKGDLDILPGSSVTIVGDGPDQTIIDGNGDATGDRVFDVAAGANLQIGGATIRNGRAGVGFEGGVHGGGIQSHGSLILQNVDIHGNRASEDGARGGGIAILGASATLNNVSVRDNEALSDAGRGGGIANAGLLTMQNSTIARNKSRMGGGIDNTGANAAAGLTNVTISDNEVFMGAGATGKGGGIGQGDHAAPAATLALLHVTLAGNRAAGGGQNLAAHTGSKSVTVRNTLFADGAPENCQIDPRAGYTSGGHNVASDATCNLSATGDRSAINVQLGPLADNGGLTPTRALSDSSAAIDGCDPNATTETDQRGESRKDGNGDGDAVCDVGAYEAPAGQGGDQNDDGDNEDDDNEDGDNDDDQDNGDE